MPTATLTVELPGNVWVGKISREFPDAQIRPLAAVTEGRDGVLIAELQADNLDAMVSDIRASEDVSNVVVQHRTDEEMLVQIDTTSAILLDHAQRAGIPIEMPFTIEDGTTVWEITASRERLSRLGDLFAADEIPFTVLAINHDIDREDLLTDTQWEVLMAAVNEGYYDTPRNCTQTELAEQLDLAKSTCSETLHRAEERIIKRFVEQHADGAEDDSTREISVRDQPNSSINRAD